MFAMQRNSKGGSSRGGRGGARGGRGGGRGRGRGGGRGGGAGGGRDRDNEKANDKGKSDSAAGAEAANGKDGETQAGEKRKRAVEPDGGPHAGMRGAGIPAVMSSKKSKTEEES